MNLNPNQPDLPDDIDLIDEAMLHEALAQPTPAELESKILALTDPQMLSLLDEALAPEAAPDQLTHRILAATTGQVQNDRPVILARIGSTGFRYAAAAAITLAVGLGGWFVNQEASDTDAPIAGVVKTPEVDPGQASDDAAGTDPAWLTSEYAFDTDFFDSDLDEVADNLEDVTISRDTIWSELDAYEQFLSDLESDDV